MTWPRDWTALALSAPENLPDWPADRLSQLFRQARAASLLGRLANSVAELEASQREMWPPSLAAHFASARRVSSAQQSEIRREAHFLGRALASLGEPVVLLKGAAYVMAELPAARGRVFSDTDIMVPKPALAAAESLLMHAGWVTTLQSAYDQRYYRQWMHELPPMQHVRRQTFLDVHHTILPETARLHPVAERLFEDSVPLVNAPGLRVLSPPDMVLHSMTHLFLNDDMSHALRDLSDLDLLLRHFGREPGFWPQLMVRADVHDLRRPLYYGLRYTSQLLGTPLPATTAAAMQTAAPNGPLDALMDAIWRRALRSPHPSSRAPQAGLALFALYLRGHWLRMPPLLLARHLTIKALRLHERHENSGAAAAPR
jgi:hypothetical protein